MAFVAHAAFSFVPGIDQEDLYSVALSQNYVKR